MTFGAPVPALRLETWKLVGWKCSVPRSQHAADQLGERRRQGVHRVLRQLRVGDVPLHAVYREATAQGAAPPTLTVSPSARSLEGSPDQAPVDALAALAQVLHHGLGAIDRGAFLVRGDQEGDRALVMPGARW